MTKLLTTAAIALALSLAACGSEDPSSSPSSTGRDSAGTAQDAALKFSRCMREHGIDMPDPTPGQPTRLRVDRGSAAKMDAAQKACGKIMEAALPKLSPAEQAEMRDQALKFARCMREHGVDMPDPQVDGNGGIMRRFGGPGRREKGLSPESPAFKAAQKACEDLMPVRRREAQEEGR